MEKRLSKNPYSLQFGSEPVQEISRLTEVNELVDMFSSEPVTQQVYMVTGVRGSGKTVFMTTVSNILRQRAEWSVVELNVEGNLVEDLTSQLVSDDRLAQLFRNAKINLSLFGFAFSIEGTQPITNGQTAVMRMLETMKKHGKKLLITIDEVIASKQMKEFAGMFQILVRNRLPVYLIMTGLYDNIQQLQNERTLTFLYRAPKLELQPLNIGSIASNYEKVLGIKRDKALELARSTKGYPFAFQVLGYLMWGRDCTLQDILDIYRQYLEEYVYEKIWAEASKVDRDVMYGMATAPSAKVSEIREQLQMEGNMFNQYRKRLVRKGIVNADVRGYLYFKLPLFEQFVMENYDSSISF